MNNTEKPADILEDLADPQPEEMQQELNQQEVAAAETKIDLDEVTPSSGSMQHTPMRSEELPRARA